MKQKTHKWLFPCKASQSTRASEYVTLRIRTKNLNKLRFYDDDSAGI